MKKEKIVRYTTEQLKSLEMNSGDKTDWQGLNLLKDEDIRIDKDSPEITEEMFFKAITPQQNKTEIKLSLDADRLLINH